MPTCAICCAICRKQRKREQLQDDRLVCKDRSKCLRIAANEMLSGPTRAQTAAKRITRGITREAAEGF